MSFAADTKLNTVTSKEALRSWKTVTDQALRNPVVITSHGRPRHVLMAYDDYRRLRMMQRQAYSVQDLPDDLSGMLLTELGNLRSPRGTAGDEDTIVD